MAPHVLLVLFYALEGEVFCEYETLGRTAHVFRYCGWSISSINALVHAFAYIRVGAWKAASLLLLFLFESIPLFYNTPKVFGEEATWRNLITFGLMVGFLFALLSILHGFFVSFVSFTHAFQPPIGFRGLISTWSFEMHPDLGVSQ